MKLKIVSFLSSLVIISLANAQFRLGAQISALKLPASAGNYGTSIGPGIDVSYSPEDSKFEYFFNAAYFLASKSNSPYTIYSTDGTQSTDVALISKTSLIGLVLGSRYFFMDRTENDFSLYASVNANLVLANTKASFSTIPAGYPDPSSDNSGASGNSSQVMIGLGLGGEYNVGGGSLFLEAQLRFPASTYNSRTGYSSDVQIPGHFWYSLGYRFSLGGD